MPKHIYCGMCNDTGLQNGKKCPQPGCRKANGLAPFNDKAVTRLRKTGPTEDEILDQSLHKIYLTGVEIGFHAHEQAMNLEQAKEYAAKLWAGQPVYPARKPLGTQVIAACPTCGAPNANCDPPCRDGMVLMTKAKAAALAISFSFPDDTEGQ